MGLSGLVDGLESVLESTAKGVLYLFGIKDTLFMGIF